jgi:cell division protein FtsB
MKGDFTRNTFDPLKHFSRVLMQQGRVQLDADFNEQTSILLHYLQTMMTDLIGQYGGPVDLCGFEIASTGRGDDFTIGPGHYYVDGILCENNRNDLTILGQEGFANAGKLEKGETYYVYLDVWERHITYVQDDFIREKALGGPDTCSRAEVVWQVRLHKVLTDVSADAKKKINAKIKAYRADLKKEETEKKKIGDQIKNLEKEVKSLGAAVPTCPDIIEWLEQLKLNHAFVKARIQPISGEPDECTEHPEARYRGTENQLYRIEIHLGGEAGTATFKWSRDNGSVVFPIIRQNGDKVTLQSLGRDERTSLKEGDWVEILDDDIELRGEPGVMAVVKIVDKGTMTVSLKRLDDGTDWPDYWENSPNHPLLRRWDQRLKEGISMSKGTIVINEGKDGNGWIQIEDGIEIQFQPGGQYRTGDYWLIPARATTGKIEWPRDTSGKEAAVPPHGIEHHYAPLAVLIKGKPTDCRCKFKVPCAANEST